MFKDIISYQLADGITEEHLLKTAKIVLDTWMKDQPGFIKWEIHKTNEEFIDIVSWESIEAAQNAEKKMGEIPNGQDWFACYKQESITTKRVNQLIF